MPRYERLRASVLSGSPRREAGWAVFLRRGLWAWCQTLDERPPAAETPLIQVLASMVLAVQQENDHGD